MKVNYKKFFAAIAAAAMCAVPMTNAMYAGAAPEPIGKKGAITKNDDEEKWNKIIEKLAAQAFMHEYQIVEITGDGIVLEETGLEEVVLTKKFAVEETMYTIEFDDPCGSVPGYVKMKRNGRKVHFEPKIFEILGTPLDPGYIDPINPVFMVEIRNESDAIVARGSIAGGKYASDAENIDPRILTAASGKMVKAERF